MLSTDAAGAGTRALTELNLGWNMLQLGGAGQFLHVDRWKDGKMEIDVLCSGRENQYSIPL